MSIRPPGRLASGPNPQCTNANGGVRIQVRSRGPGTYILVYNQTNAPGGAVVPCSSGEVGAVIGGRVVRKNRFGGMGNAGR